jgi:hypothetical protein
VWTRCSIEGQLVRAQLFEVRRHLDFIERKIAIYEEKLNG